MNHDPARFTQGGKRQNERWLDQAGEWEQPFNLWAVFFGAIGCGFVLATPFLIWCIF